MQEKAMLQTDIIYVSYSTSIFSQRYRGYLAFFGEKL